MLLYGDAMPVGTQLQVLMTDNTFKATVAPPQSNKQLQPHKQTTHSHCMSQRTCVNEPLIYLENYVLQFFKYIFPSFKLFFTYFFKTLLGGI